MKNRILIDKQIYDRDITKKFVKGIANSILNILNLEKSELSIILTDDQTIRNINREWRGKDIPTDVLSFPMEDSIDHGYKILGDVIISLPFAKKQAELINYTYREEVLRLLIHGVLHLLGYDHERSEEDEKVMMDIQDRIFDELKSGI